MHLVLLSVDEGISGYRDDSLATVAQNKIDYGLELLVVSYQELFNGWTMDKIVKLVGLGTNCTFCGILRRAALELGARKLGVDFIATGHNADDIGETVLMNVLRGDLNRLKHCTDFATNDVSLLQSFSNNNFVAVPRIKPFKYTFEKEIVMYAYFRKLLYFSTECTYAPGAFRGHARTFLKDLERLSPTYILNIIKSGEEMAKMIPNTSEEALYSSIVPCEKCGGMANLRRDEEEPVVLCKACSVVLALDSNRPLSILGNSKKYQQCTLNEK